MTSFGEVVERVCKVEHFCEVGEFLKLGQVEDIYEIANYVKYSFFLKN